jgi:glycine cleavage system H protein
MPLGGEVLEVNTDLEESPALVNEDPYKKGWMIAVKPGDLSEIEALMDSDAYLDMLRGL